MHPKEKNPSTFIGCEYAEKRAIIKGLKEEKKLLYAQLKVMKEYCHLISNMKDTNPKGTEIYDGQTATGMYYNGPTLTGVNTRYASDKNWANAVFKWMTYLYNRL